VLTTAIDVKAKMIATKAQLWELPTSAHTKGLRDHPVTNAHRVRSLFDRALLTSATGS
jgi:hypothetical protein